MAMIAKRMTLALALLFALPLSACAENNSYTLKLSDPVMTTTAGGATTVQDFAGVAAELTGASADGGDIQMSLTLLADGDPAATATLGATGDLAFLMVDGLSRVITLPIRDANITQIDHQLEQIHLALVISNLLSRTGDLPFAQGAEETVQFYDSIGRYPRHYIHLDHADLVEYFVPVLRQNISADISRFTDGGGNFRTEGKLYNVLSNEVGEDAHVNFVVVEKRDGDHSGGTGWFGNDEKEVEFEYSTAPSAEFPGHAEFEITALADDYDNNTLDKDMRLQLTGRPTQMEDGSIAQNITGSVYILNVMTATINCLAHVTDESEAYQLDLKDITSPNTASVSYSGNIESTETGIARSGVITASAAYGATAYTIAADLNLTLSNDTGGKLADISAMPQLRTDTMTTEETDQLIAEAQRLGFVLAGRFMSIPSVAAVIAQWIQ